MTELLARLRQDRVDRAHASIHRLTVCVTIVQGQNCGEPAMWLSCRQDSRRTPTAGRWTEPAPPIMPAHSNARLASAPHRSETKQVAGQSEAAGGEEDGSQPTRPWYVLPLSR